MKDLCQTNRLIVFCITGLALAALLVNGGLSVVTLFFGGSKTFPMINVENILLVSLGTLGGFLGGRASTSHDSGNNTLIFPKAKTDEVPVEPEPKI